MTERLLQYIWQFQYYNKNELYTTAGEELVIIHPGIYNTHQGPDFSEGRIRIQGNTWVGNIELHVNSMDWHRHHHSRDKNYSNVILHVVWKDDEAEPQHKIPTLVLGDRVPKLLMHQYYSWMKEGNFIPCESTAGSADDLIWTGWKDRLMVERLERKSEAIMGVLKRNKFHWEETLWSMLARNFGLYVNADAFGEMATSIPYNLLSKHRLQIHQLEALLFGQAGLLENECEDKYFTMLKKEYLFLKKKYDLAKIHAPVHFLRMRPACFPSVRLAQLAMLIHSSDKMLSAIIDAESVNEVKRLFDVTANDYWHYHFRFGEEAAYQPKVLGAEMINNVMVNTVIVMLFTYGKYHNETRHQVKAIEWIGQLPAEHNTVMSKFRDIGVAVKNAADSQSLIELKSQYCDKKRCLDCAVANAILKKNKIKNPLPE